jgi:hypothetical protein
MDWYKKATVKTFSEYNEISLKNNVHVNNDQLMDLKNNRFKDRYRDLMLAHIEQCSECDSRYTAFTGI